MYNIYDRLESLGVKLPGSSPAGGNYVQAVTVNNLVYLSGNDCSIDGTPMMDGKVGGDLTIEQGQIAARQTMINLLAELHCRDWRFDWGKCWAHD